MRAMEESVASFCLLAKLATPPRAVALRLSIPPSKNKEIPSLYFTCGRWRNRTPAKSFGDFCSTTKLIAHNDWIVT